MNEQSCAFASANPNTNQHQSPSIQIFAAFYPFVDFSCFPETPEMLSCSVNPFASVFREPGTAEVRGDTRTKENI
jgi:hypothetical protein